MKELWYLTVTLLSGLSNFEIYYVYQHWKELHIYSPIKYFDRFHIKNTLVISLFSSIFSKIKKHQNTAEKISSV